MTPQTQLVLKHLCYAGSLTGAEAATVHRIRHLPRRIADLKEWGIPVETTMKRDITGQRYASYSLPDYAPPVSKPAEQSTAHRVSMCGMLALGVYQ